ncbi:MAG: hypothetical protein CMJ78_06410 [Planctomycetaceae bacterium]|nr:hypothetical protein [Planctomycetaceae bacterium]
MSTENDLSPDERPAPSLRRWALIVFGLALLLRIVHVWQLDSAPFGALRMGDSTSYHQWAEEIAGGNVIGDEVFYQAPLYPYFLGMVYATVGESVTTVRVVQSIMGSAACVLMMLACWQWFNARTGIVAGTLLSFFAPAIFFDGLIQKSVLDLFFLSLLLWLLGQWSQSPKPRTTIFIGVVTGGLLLTRENAILLVPLLLFWQWMRTSEKRWQPITLCLAGMFLVLFPVALRNKIVGGEFHLTTSQFGPNFYIGNNPNADGTYRPLRARRAHPKFERQDAFDIAAASLGKTPTPGEVSSYFVQQSLNYIKSKPTEWFKLTARKFALTWNAVELVDTEDQYTFAEWSLPLTLTQRVAHFGALVVLSALGVCVTWQQRKEHWFLHAAILIYTASIVMFYLMARYRFPLVPFLIPFAAAGIVNVRDYWKQASAKNRAITIGIVLGVGVFSNWPLVPIEPMRAATLYNIGAQLDLEGRGDESIPFYEASLKLRPDSVEALYNLAHAESRRANFPTAVDLYRRVIELSPQYIDAHNNLGLTYANMRRFEEAEQSIRKAIFVNPKSAASYNNLGSIFAMQSNFDQATKHFTRAAEVDENYAEPLVNLGMISVQKKEFEQAQKHFQRALEIDPNHLNACFSLGNINAEQRDFRAAIQWYQRCLEINPNFQQAHQNLQRAEALLRGN